MLLIPCPNCGPRAEVEFAYGGPLRPLPAMEGGADASAHQLALHRGAGQFELLRELWFHASGCEHWITVTRDILTHRVTAAAIGEEAAS